MLRMAEPITALVVPLPEADARIRRWREVYDPSGRLGFPAHVTILAPFVPPDRIDEAVLADLRSVLAGFDGFDVVFRRTARFFDTLYLAPEPDEPFREMTRALVARWPEHPPYGGEYPDPTPHATVAHAQDEETFAAIEAEVTEVLPIDARVTEVRLFAGSNETDWEEVATIPLVTP
jgi:hypothetical protein